MGQQNLVDFARSYFFAAAIDELLDTAGESEISLGVDNSLVAGAEPAIGERRGVRFGLVFVAVDDVRSLDHDFAALAGGKVVAFTVHDAHFDAGARSHRTGLTRG